MALLELPEPYAFELSTARYRAFGTDLANLWHEGGLHRVVDGREVRITEAPGGVDVQPLDAEIGPVVRRLLGAEFDLDVFYAFAATEPVLADSSTELRGLRPPIAVEPFESLVTSITAQQVSLHAAFAIRNRLIERFGVRAEHAYSFPTRERLAAAEPDELFALGFSHRKAEYATGLARSDLDLDALALLADDEVKAALTALPRDRRVDGRLVPRPSSGAAPRVARGRPRRAQGGLALLRRRPRPDDDEVRALGERFDPFQNLTAHYLLAGLLRGT